MCSLIRFEVDQLRGEFDWYAAAAIVSAEFDLKMTPEQVLVATQNFNDQIGEGSMSTVYRGVLPTDSSVAVKKLDIQRSDINENYFKFG